MSLKFLFILFVAGGLGTLARYGLSSLVTQLAWRGFPWGTFTVNIIDRKSVV